MLHVLDMNGGEDLVLVFYIPQKECLMFHTPGYGWTQASGIPGSQQGKLDCLPPCVADPLHANSNTDSDTHPVIDTMVTIIILVI